MVNNNLKNSNASFVNLKDNTPAARYVKDIMSKKPITASEEKELFRKYYSNETSKAEKDAIRDEILTKNQRFVYAIAKRYAQDETLLDLIGEGNLGMIEAFDSFDYTRGNRFCTQAVWYIRRAINAYITTGNMMIKKSNNTKTLSKAMAIQEKFFNQEERYATYDELLELMNNEYGKKTSFIDEDGNKVEDSTDLIKDIRDLYDLRIDSIDTGYDDEDEQAFENSDLFVSHSCVGEGTVYNEDSTYANGVIDYLKGYLTSKEKEVIELCFGEKELSNKEVGEILGISSERARQLKNSAIKKMQEHAQEAKAIV